MRHAAWLATTVAFAALLPAAAHAQTSPADQPAKAADAQAATPAQSVDAAQQTPERAARSDSQDVVVTARRREESLKDVPIAITALTGDFLKQQQVNAVKDVANYTPGLTINSDSVGRAFVSIRGIGTTLIDTVQPGVGLFIDGVYQPNTSYLNSPIVDVARIEVLRGPQGTLFGNNTLGGAINIVTRQPSNEWTGRVDAAIAGPDSYASVSGTISGPIVKDLLQFRIGASYHEQNGFGRNTLAGAYLNPLEDHSVNGTLRFTPASWAVLTLNGNYDHTYGGNTQYIHVTGPTDYHLDGQTNQPSRAGIAYKGVSLKGEFSVDPINTKITAIAAYNRKDLGASGDGDYGAVDLLRTNGGTQLTTITGELRFDTQWGEHVSTLIGLYADQYIQRATSINALNLTALYAALGVPLVVPVNTSTSYAYTRNNTEAAFGTVFLKFGKTDLAIGGRYDHQHLIGDQFNTAAIGAPAVGFVPPDYVKDEFQPRVTLTEHWTPDFMTYASVAKGFRGGGQNGPGTPTADLVYKGDHVWTYEVGAKYGRGGLQVSGDVFYNDYDDFIGQNSLAPKVGGGFVAINLNTGHVESYGAELEAHLAITPQWRVDGGVAYLHARITDDSEYQATIGVPVSTDRIIFTPDYDFNASTTYTLPVGASSVIANAGVFGKGSRIGSTLDPAVAPRLAPYAIANASLGVRFPIGLEVALFGTNVFNKKFIESYIDKSALVKAGLAPIASNLAVEGDRARYGVRTTFKF